MGEEFIKKIRPAGAALFLILGVLMVLVCFTAGRDPIRGYKAPESTEYYAAHPEELLAELETNVFPHVEGIVSAGANEHTVTIGIASDKYVITRAALLRYFDETLLELVRVEEP